MLRSKTRWIEKGENNLEVDDKIFKKQRNIAKAQRKLLP